MAGERRLRACKRIGMKTVDARIIQENGQAKLLE
ncbi:MAG: ParB N-terminal domain-containing protein [Nitrososphaerales archaeon]